MPRARNPHVGQAVGGFIVIDATIVRVDGERAYRWECATCRRPTVRTVRAAQRAAHCILCKREGRLRTPSPARIGRWQCADTTVGIGQPNTWTCRRCSRQRQDSASGIRRRPGCATCNRRAAVPSKVGSYDLVSRNPVGHAGGNRNRAIYAWQCRKCRKTVERQAAGVRHGCRTCANRRGTKMKVGTLRGCFTLLIARAIGYTSYGVARYRWRCIHCKHVTTRTVTSAIRSDKMCDNCVRTRRFRPKPPRRCGTFVRLRDAPTADGYLWKCTKCGYRGRRTRTEAHKLCGRCHAWKPPPRKLVGTYELVSPKPVRRVRRAGYFAYYYRYKCRRCGTFWTRPPINQKQSSRCGVCYAIDRGYNVGDIICDVFEVTHVARARGESRCTLKCLRCGASTKRSQKSIANARRKGRARCNACAQSSLIIAGRTVTKTEIERLWGLPYATVWQRIHVRGLSPEQAVLQPLGKRRGVKSP